MEIDVRRYARSEGEALDLPDELVAKDELFPVVFVDVGRRNLTEDPNQEMVNEGIYDALQLIHSRPVPGQALIKVHVGEPKCLTRMRPEYVASSVKFLRDLGATGIVAGDTSVAYTGPRGHRENPKGDASSYLGLARKQGWSSSGIAGVPFAVLDRPCTALSGQFEFETDERQVRVPGMQHYGSFDIADGFAAAEMVMNHAHLTLHQLAGVAGCVKSIAMGCSSLAGKLRMHQSLLPRVDNELCDQCGQCVDNCPEKALSLGEGASSPSVNTDLCIGCGECVTSCPNGAITLEEECITDWVRGKHTFPLRLADCTVGIMNRRWQKTIHILHMYSITEHCDCLNGEQSPLLRDDIGFLVGKNPFAIDRLAAEFLTSRLGQGKANTYERALQAAGIVASYVEEKYGIVCDTSLTTLRI